MKVLVVTTLIDDGQAYQWRLPATEAGTVALCDCLADYLQAKITERSALAPLADQRMNIQIDVHFEELG